MMIIFVIFGGAIGLLAATEGDVSSLPLVWWIGIGVAIAGLGTLRANMHAKRHRRVLEGIRIVVSEVGIVYQKAGLSTNIPVENLKSMTLLANGKVKIRSKGNLPVTVPAFVEKKESFITALEKLGTLDRR